MAFQDGPAAWAAAMAQSATGSETERYRWRAARVENMFSDSSLSGLVAHRGPTCGADPWADPLVRGRRPRRPPRSLQAAGPGGPARTRGSAPQGYSTVTLLARLR